MSSGRWSGRVLVFQARTGATGSMRVDSISQRTLSVPLGWLKSQPVPNGERWVALLACPAVPPLSRGPAFWFVCSWEIAVRWGTAGQASSGTKTASSGTGIRSPDPSKKGENGVDVSRVVDGVNKVCRRPE